ncbi:MAG TPA: hypothetical protein VIS99_16115 [Terrimicrobiaceae bacterium]
MRELLLRCFGPLIAETHHGNEIRVNRLRGLLDDAFQLHELLRSAELASVQLINLRGEVLKGPFKLPILGLLDLFSEILRVLIYASHHGLQPVTDATDSFGDTVHEFGGLLDFAGSSLLLSLKVFQPREEFLFLGLQGGNFGNNGGLFRCVPALDFLDPFLDLFTFGIEGDPFTGADEFQFLRSLHGIIFSLDGLSSLQAFPQGFQLRAELFPQSLIPCSQLCFQVANEGIRRANRALRGIYLRGQGRGQIFGQLVLVVLDEGLQVGRDAGNRFEGFAQRVIAMDVNLRDIIEQPPSDAADVGLSHRNDMQQTGREFERAGEDRLLGRVIL